MRSRCSWFSHFLLVIISITLPRHLALAAPPTRRSPSSSEESSSSSAPASIVWSSPAPGDRFGPGDTIPGEWHIASESQNQKVVSPSFKLCAGGEDGCGATVWPEVVLEESTGNYYVSLTAPNVTTESGYYLQMKDDFGHAYTSPIFNLTPAPQQKDKPAAPAEPEVAQPRPDQAPMSSSSSSSSSSSHGTNSKGSSHSDPIVPVPSTAASAAQVGPSGTASGGIPSNSTANLTPGSNNSNGGGISGPLVAAAHSAPPTAALAVPLSLAGAIILLAGGLALHHRRKLAAEGERCRAQIASANSRDATSSSTSSSSDSARSLRPVGLALDLGRTRSGGGGGGSGSRKDGDSEYHYGDPEKALVAARALLRGGGFSDRAYDADAYYDRRAEDAKGASYSRAPSSYARGVREPRLRTRQPDPLTLTLTREFTTSRRPSSSSPSSSSSLYGSYRGIFGNRHSVRRSGSNHNYHGGASSLWRSLSIARRRASPSSASLASPALTESVASVTSEVLPSYLPSPKFLGATTQSREYEHGAGAGDFGFENVPLSPPPPPPLHTRREAVEPDDPRMRELRGVYEAVAHALGGIRRL